MFKYTTKYINIVSFVISIIIFLILNFFNSSFNQIIKNADLKAGFNYSNSIVEQELDDKKQQVIQVSSNNINDENEDWYLEIPNINLKAKISEGTTKEVMDRFVGHFEETPKLIGNVALAAHNRGYENNYFQNLKNIKEGDNILYGYKGKTKEYIVEKHLIIKDTDLSCLENTDENMITLITCVENEPEYRRCIKGIEKIGKEE